MNEEDFPPEFEDLPRLFHHCRTVYEAMLGHASTEEVEGKEVLVYAGHLTKLVTEDVGLALPYHTKVRRALLDMQCVSQIQRGGSSAVSKYILHGPPTNEAWLRAIEEGPSYYKSGRHRAADVVTQAMHDFRERLDKVERDVDAILESIDYISHKLDRRETLD